MEIDLSEQSLPVFDALASKTRLKILNYIGSGKKSIGEIANYVQLSTAIITRHVQQLEDAGLLDSERGTGINRNKKLVFAKVDHIKVVFPEKIYKEYHLHSTSLPIGQYVDFKAKPTCGLASSEGFIGTPDVPKFFMDSKRMDAGILWLNDGFVEYKIPNLIQKNQIPELLEISLEIASEFPKSNNAWPSDISIFVNDIKIATYTVSGNYSDVRGRLNPNWWDINWSQYGEYKHIFINKFDSGIDGKTYSNVTIRDLNLENNPFIKLRFEIEENAKNKGGMTLFGKGFGNIDKDILVNLYYL